MYRKCSEANLGFKLDLFVAPKKKRTKFMTTKEHAALMKLQWEATWPNDAFVAQLLRYEDDLRK